MGTFIGKNTGYQLRLIILALLPLVASAQSSKDSKKTFAQAESYYLYMDYEPANKLYLKLETPDNFNIKFKIGTCYLNIPGEKEKAIPYLESAVKNASYESKTESFTEKRAPIDAWFFLAKAYMINNEPEKGMATLLTLQKITKESKSVKPVKNPEYIDQQIEACKNIITLRKNPVAFKKEQVRSGLTLGKINENPAVSFDGNTMVYTERNEEINIIFSSKKVNGKWQPPVDITSELKAGDDCASCSLNYDGTELFLYKTGNYDGVIYSSKLVKGKWTPIVKLNSNINTKYYESHAAVSADGNKLYFASNREGGLGNLDIYVSERANNGDWGTAYNLGTPVNTQFNEDTPFITQNDSLLYFSSEGHSTMGGYDIFRSTKNNDNWDIPQNLGYPFNTPDDDKFFQPANNGANGYYSVTTGYQKKDIYYFSFGKEVSSDLAEKTPVTVPVETNQPVVNNPVIVEETTSKSIPETNNASMNIRVVDVNENMVKDTVLFYTVQVIALHKPVEINFFKDITDIRVMYDDNDKFYRYVTGRFLTREEAELHKAELLAKGYAEQIFVKKIIKSNK
jgi:hypothetical protein